MRNFIHDPAPEKTTNTKQTEIEEKTEEGRRIMLELSDDENDLDYYSSSNLDSGYDHQTYI